MPSHCFDLITAHEQPLCLVSLSFEGAKAHTLNFEEMGVF